MPETHGVGVAWGDLLWYVFGERLWSACFLAEAAALMHSSLNYLA